MYEGLRSPNIYNPSTITELSAILQSHPDAIFWAGGTSLMRRKDSYPSSKSEEIIFLGQIDELRRFQRNDRLVEFGSMVTLDEILSVARTVIPEVLVRNIESIGGKILTRRITIGGAIKSRETMSSIPGTLSILDASCEVRTIKKKRLHSKWYPISYLFGKNAIQYGLISRIRIPIYERNVQEFKTAGSFVRERDSAVAISFVANQDQNVINDARFSFSIPTAPFVSLREIDNMMQTVRFPLDPKEAQTLVNMILESLSSEIKLSPVQAERIKGLLKEIVGNINIRILSTPMAEAK